MLKNESYSDIINYEVTRMENFCSRLNLLIKESGKYVTDVSRETGIARTTLQGYITGAREPKRANHNLETLAKYFNVDEVWLLGFDVDRERMTREEKTARLNKQEELLNKFWKLPKTSQDTIESMINQLYELTRK